MGVAARWTIVRGFQMSENVDIASALTEVKNMVLVELVVWAKMTGSKKGCTALPKGKLRRVCPARTTKAALKQKYNYSLSYVGKVCDTSEMACDSRTALCESVLLFYMNVGLF